MVTETEILSSSRGSVIAPAGCGKTELILNTIRTAGTGRFLVLTHTHAGVRALRARMKRLDIPKELATIETIAGWALGYSRAYPVSSGLTNFLPEKAEWNDVYLSATTLLNLRFIQKIIKASYAGVFVDEYQDCTVDQHTLICALADIIPCRVFGDPLQGIFAFCGGTLSWIKDVQVAFPLIGTLEYPWRWDGKNVALGEWLIQIREDLIAGNPIDLTKAPVTWRQKDPQSQVGTAQELLGREGRVVVVRKWPNDAHEFAKRVGRAYVSMEEVDCKDLLTFARRVEGTVGIARVLRILDFAEQCMTGVTIHTANIKVALQTNRQLRMATMNIERRSVAEALLKVMSSNEASTIIKALSSLGRLPNTRIFRRELWNEAIKALASHQGGTYRDSAWKSRNRTRYQDRVEDVHIVSRTLLIKGLEFEHSFIPDAEEFNGYDGAKLFYVAATRGSHSLTILSNSHTVQFLPPSI